MAVWAGFAIATLVLGVAIFVLFVWAPAWATRPPREFPDYRFDAADRYRQTLFAAVGGLAVLLTFGWTFEKDRETLLLSANQGANKQYLDAAKMLAGPGLSTKTAAIYAFGNLARTQPSLYLPVRETILSFIGDEPAVDKIYPDGEHGSKAIDGAVQAAIQVLGRRDTSNDRPNWPLAMDDRVLSGGRFHHLSGFSGISFQGAELYAADFRCADLSDAIFDGASMGDYKADPSWNEAIANTSAWERWEKYRFITNFEGAILRKTQFRGANLAGAVFVNADVAGADFSGANLSRADFAGARHLTEAVFVSSRGTACADTARFDAGTVSLPACHPGQIVSNHKFDDASKHLTFSADPATCVASVSE